MVLAEVKKEMWDKERAKEKDKDAKGSSKDEPGGAKPKAPVPTKGVDAHGWEQLKAFAEERTREAQRKAMMR